MLDLLPHVADAAHELKPERDKLADELHKQSHIVEAYWKFNLSKSQLVLRENMSESGDLFMSTFTLDAAD